MSRDCSSRIGDNSGLRTLGPTARASRDRRAALPTRPSSKTATSRVAQGRISSASPGSPPHTAAAAAAPERGGRQPYTHIVRRENRKRVLMRIRFLCR